MRKRVKLDDLPAIFISRDDDSADPRYTFEHQICEEHIVHVLVPWFLVCKKYGVPKDIVKLIANLLPNRYYRCPVWKFIKHCLDCPIPSINTHQGRAGHIYSYFHYAIPSRQKHFEFYAHVIGQQCHRPCKTFTMGDTGVAIEQENVVFYFYFHDMDIGGVVTIDENFLQSNGFL